MAGAFRIIIVGGGTAGWMCAAALSRLLDPQRFAILLVESDEIPTIGVGEATLPQIRAFHDLLGLDEADFIRETGATFKLGIEFDGWGPAGSPAYIHPFGTFGEPWGGVDFHQHWRRAGKPAPFQSYSFTVEACRQARFAFPGPGDAYSYAYHLDAGLYAAYLRRWATARHVVRQEGQVVDVGLDPASGAIAAVSLKSGEKIEGDLFVDASGFRSLLLGGALKAPWEDWSAWLPCDRALALPTGHLPEGDFGPYTRAIAQKGGWIWRIPLQHRVGNGYVYSSRFLADDEALATLERAVPGTRLAEPRSLRFSAGRRLEAWTKNCVGIGLSSGFLEPLESTSIYLIQQAVLFLAELMPTKAGPVDPRLAREFNRAIDLEYERVRDFLILHYHANGRAGEVLWDEARRMPIPDSLALRLALFQACGHVPTYKDGLFNKDSWLSVLLGQGVSPRAAAPLAEAAPLEAVTARMADLRQRIVQRVGTLPGHRDFLSREALKWRPR